MDIMEAAAAAGATHSAGNAWVWMGADGFAAANPKAVSPALQTAFQGSVASNVKMGSDNSTLYIDFLAKWREVHPQRDWPWASSNVIALNAYTVIKSTFLISLLLKLNTHLYGYVYLIDTHRPYVTFLNFSSTFFLKIINFKANIV